MAKDVEIRIRKLPGNDKCVDCNNITPQWASVSYGTLMCLECSGKHRALGVHLSFVRSIAMDSWKPRQIEAMEKSGGNAKTIEYLESRGITKTMDISAKYSTKQASYLRERLTRWLDGRREPPPDPGRYDPSTGVSEAQGAEALPGETTEQYNARQARLREAARERLRAKFGGSGIGSGNNQSMGSPEPEQRGEGLGGLIGSLGSFVKNNVIDNENVRGVVRGAGGVAGGAINSLREKIQERGGSGSNMDNGSGGGYNTGGGSGQTSNDDEDFFANIGQKKGSGGGGYGGGGGSFGSNSGKPQPKKTGFEDDTWGDDFGAAPATNQMSMGGGGGAISSMSSGRSSNKPTPAKKDTFNINELDDDDFFASIGQSKKVSAPELRPPADGPAEPSLDRAKSAPAPAPTPAPAPAPKAEVPKTKSAESVSTTATVEKPKAKPKAKLDEPDDFFAQFGV